VERKNKKLQPLLVHRWMLNEVTGLVNATVDEIHQNENLSIFTKQELSHCFKMMKENKSAIAIIAALKMKLIPFYHELAIKSVNDDEVEFNYLKNN
jgi:hypothetical protein